MSPACHTNMHNTNYHKLRASMTQISSLQLQTQLDQRNQNSIWTVICLVQMFLMMMITRTPFHQLWTNSKSYLITLALSQSITQICLMIILRHLIWPIYLTSHYSPILELLATSLSTPCQISATLPLICKLKLANRTRRCYFKMPLITRMNNFKLEKWNPTTMHNQANQLLSCNAHQIKWVPTAKILIARAKKLAPKREAERPILKRARSLRKSFRVKIWRWIQIQIWINHQRNIIMIKHKIQPMIRNPQQTA